MIGEFAVLPLVFGLRDVAIIFSLLNAAILTVRIRAENRALGRSTLPLATLGHARLYGGHSPRHRKDAEAGPGGRPGSREVLNFELRSRLTDTAAIARLIEPAVKELGFDLVRVAMIGGTSDPTLQVMAERPDTRQLTIDDCADDFAQAQSDMLDAEEAAGRDPIEGGYRLEVSSPGIDRPLTRRADLCRLGRAMKRGSNIAEPVDGAKQVSGIIEGISGDTITRRDAQGRARRSTSPTSRRPSCS